MARPGLGSKLANIPIAKLKTPAGGVFAGRDIPKNRLEDPEWLRVLELQKPPEDGLYIPRNAVIPQAKPIKKRGVLYRIAKAMVDYDLAHDPKAQKKLKNTTSSPTKPASSSTDSQTYSVPKVDDWNTLSPDIEASYLGLEQLEKGESIAIIGAGISGLTLAWILSRSRPDVRIHIIDDKPEVGGWMCSTHVSLPEGYGNTLFESGPRTLLPSHPGSEIIARILYETGRRDELMAGVPRSSPTNRKGLVFDGQVIQLPNSLSQAAQFGLTSPLLKGARWKALKDLWNPARNPNVNDESVKSFVSRRIGVPLAERMVSAVMRGIYAADAAQLSARSVARLNRLFYLERTEKMSMLGAMFSGSLGYIERHSREALPLAFDALAPPSKGSTVTDRQLVNRENPIPKFSMYGFKQGIQSAARAIASDLKQRKNVEFHLGSGVRSINLQSARLVRLELEDGTELDTNIAVSTVARPDMFRSASPELSREIEQVKYSSLAVVNVWVPDANAAKDWFGVLVPKTEDQWNDIGVLGVIFDSSVRNATKEDPAEHEKGSSMTVMMGGDLWDPSLTEFQAKQNALDGLKKLKLIGPSTKLEDTVMNVAMQRNAIPLYEVGHSQRQHFVHGELARVYNGRVALIGMAFGRGCGVSDCAVDALTIALRFSEQRRLLHPDFFFNHWWSATRPEYYA